ncbi:MAG: Carboxylesterase 2 [Pseudomonas citronellolis]|nr:MAG: Carboxylesterase 2 [Pseudomonas citronellolis]
MSHLPGYSELLHDTASGLRYRRLLGVDAPTGRLLLLHGVGGNETHLAGLAPHLPRDLDVLLVQGPLQLAPNGFAFFPVQFTAAGPRIDEAQAEASRQALLKLLHGLPALPTVIAGFSQGGIMSASVGLSAPHQVAGFGLLSGRILPELEPHLATPEALRPLRAFIAHGRHDDKLPPAWAERASDWLQRLGVEHHLRFYDMGHELCRQEVEEFADWLLATLANTQPNLEKTP